MFFICIVGLFISTSFCWCDVIVFIMCLDVCVQKRWWRRPLNNILFICSEPSIKFTHAIMRTTNGLATLPNGGHWLSRRSYVPKNLAWRCSSREPSKKALGPQDNGVHLILRIWFPSRQRKRLLAIDLCTIVGRVTVQVLGSNFTEFGSSTTLGFCSGHSLMALVRFNYVDNSRWVLQ